MKMNNKISTNNIKDPWPDTTKNNVEESKHCFDDNFDVDSVKNDELNENGLCLPDSQKYLNQLG